MSLKLFILKGGQQIIGDIVEETDIAFCVENPVIVMPNAQGAAFFPVLAFAEKSSKQVWINRASLEFYAEGNQPFEPALELKNHWSSQFGSGIVVAGA